MTPVLVQCSCCGGSGKKKLSPALQRTLDAVPSRRFASTAEVEQRLNDRFVKKTAINNRLALYLMPRGLVVNERRGTHLFWKRVK